MAGDEDRPSPEPYTAAAAASAVDLPAHPVAADEGIAAQEPSMASAAADTARSDRAASTFGAPPVGVAPVARRSPLPVLLSIIGIVLILLLAANLYTLYNPPGDAAIPAMQAQVAALHQQLAAVPKVDLAPLDTRVTGLAGEVDRLKAAVATNAGSSAAAADVKGAVAPLETKVGDLDKGLSALGATVAGLSRADLGPLAAKVSDLDKAVAGLGDTAAANKEALAPLNDKLAAVEKRLTPLETYFDAPKSTAQVTEVRQNGSAAETRAAPVAMLAQGILSDLDDGRPFAREVKALGMLGVDAATLQPLQAVADKGAASDADLLSGFAAVQDGMVVAAAPVATGTMFDRMLANAQDLVKVSRTGAGTGGDAGAIASRIADDLKRGALQPAADEWDSLPEASKTRSAAWAGRLKGRLAAEAAARAVQDKAVAALAAAP